MDDTKLLDDFKNKLLITWEDDLTEKKIENSLESAKGHLESLTGTSLDYEKNVFAKNLLMDCTRYYYNNVSEFFEDNFSKEILRLQLLEATMEVNNDET